MPLNNFLEGFEKAFEAEIVSVADLLQRRRKNIFFEVPEFQRPYSWDE